MDYKKIVVYLLLTALVLNCTMLLYAALDAMEIQMRPIFYETRTKVIITLGLLVYSFIMYRFLYPKYK